MVWIMEDDKRVLRFLEQIVALEVSISVMTHPTISLVMKVAEFFTESLTESTYFESGDEERLRYWYGKYVRHLQ